MPTTGYLPWMPSATSFAQPSYGPLTPTNVPRGTNPFGAASSSLPASTQYAGLPTYATGAGAMAIPGTYTPASGGIPNPPTLGQSALAALQTGQTLLPGYESLAGPLAQWQQQNILAQQEAALPGLATARKQNIGNINSMLMGEVPTDVSNLITQKAAERGIAGGYSGAPISNIDLLKILGETGLSLEETGAQMLPSAISTTPVATPIPFGTYAPTTSQQESSDLLRALYGSAPIPQAAADQAMAAAQMGLNRGYGMGYGPGVQQRMYPQAGNITDQVLSQYGGQTLNPFAWPGTTNTNVYEPDFYDPSSSQPMEEQLMQYLYGSPTSVSEDYYSTFYPDMQEYF